eukprot:g31119.t1
MQPTVRPGAVPKYAPVNYQVPRPAGIPVTVPNGPHGNPNGSITHYAMPFQAQVAHAKPVTAPAGPAGPAGPAAPVQAPMMKMPDGSLRPYAPPVQRATASAAALFNELDQNKDGVISREEFMRMQAKQMPAPVPAPVPKSSEGYTQPAQPATAQAVTQAVSKPAPVLPKVAPAPESIPPVATAAVAAPIEKKQEPG